MQKRSTITYSHRQRTTITTMQNKVHNHILTSTKNHHHNNAKKSPQSHTHNMQNWQVTPTHSFYPQHLRRSLAVHHTRISYREPLCGEAEHIRHTPSILRHLCSLCITPESVIENHYVVKQNTFERLMWLQLSIMPKVDRLKQKRELQRVRRALLNPDVRRNEQTNDTESRRVARTNPEVRGGEQISNAARMQRIKPPQIQFVLVCYSVFQHLMANGVDHGCVRSIQGQCYVHGVMDHWCDCGSISYPCPCGHSAIYPWANETMNHAHPNESSQSHQSNKQSTITKPAIT